MEAATAAEAATVPVPVTAVDDAKMGAAMAEEDEEGLLMDDNELLAESCVSEQEVGGCAGGCGGLSGGSVALGTGQQSIDHPDIHQSINRPLNLHTPSIPNKLP